MTATVPAAPADHLEQLWADEPGLRGFLSTVDHKRIGRRYFVTSLAFLAIGGIQAMLMRTQLAVPENTFLDPLTYNRLMTMHGITMIFLFNTPIWAGFGNYVLPLQVGTRDMAFPRLNALSYWIFLFSGVLIYTSFFVGQMPEGGWFAYPTLTEAEYLQGLGLDFWAVGLAFLGMSTTVGAVNFIVTVFKLRAPGMTPSRLPIFVWAILVMSFMILFAVPAVTLAQVLLELDRLLDFNFFVASGGGDPLLYQHLFWLWGHPEVYIVFVPATGVVSTLVATFSRTRLVGYLLVATALVALGFLSFGVWVHHMFTVGIGFLALSFFSAASFLVSIPSGVQYFAWIGTLWNGKPRFQVPLLWALGMMFTFLFGGITGVMVAMVPFDFQAQDSYFVVAHFHYTLVGGSVFPVFAGLYYWFPKMTGRMPNLRVGKWAFWLTFVAFNATFFPLHVLGLWGMPRRYYTYLDDLGWGPLNLFATGAAYLLGIGFALAVLNLAWSIRRGTPAGANPWDAASLEWATSSPPPHYNFLELPRVSSRYPLWDQQMVGVGDEDVPRHGRPTLVPPEGDEEHLTLSTAGVDADPERVIPMPHPTPWPIITALAIFITLTGVLVRSLGIGLVGVIILVVAVSGWMWPKWEDEPVELERGDVEGAIR
jgi:cytochrome c oxidase subunit I+III